MENILPTNYWFKKILRLSWLPSQFISKGLKPGHATGGPDGDVQAGAVESPGG